MEVLEQIFSPAAAAAGFNVTTAERQGSDVIQSTIVNDLLAADLVLADLTEHNPNVLFELGMRMREDRPTALVRAKGTGQIFDVDNVLRVVDYDPNVWPSTVERDIPRVQEHLEATWGNRDSADTYMKILRHAKRGLQRAERQAVGRPDEGCIGPVADDRRQRELLAFESRGRIGPVQPEWVPVLS
jgi:hypothetical protein